MNENKIYTIGEVAEMVNFSKLTIKKYVRLGFVSCARNPINNYRVFDQDAVDTLIKIKSGQYEVKK